MSDKTKFLIGAALVYKRRQRQARSQAAANLSSVQVSRL